VSAFREAGPDDALALRDLERAANLVALAHVFAPEQHAFPDADVLARWQRVLADPERTTLLAQDEQGAAAYVSWDAVTLHHLAVRPDLWRTGLGREAVALCPARRLWCLAANHRARAVYERLGWRPTGEERDAEWPPHPRELRYAR
jgi:RimJ/RimL family protein N-acetyltransferase